ncbi:MAG: hypothetical protein QOE70_4418 [Chthoniobacter sp.]|jgi:predicted MFS family arabinose efflux permease|nr:hypothetical protein [Chthoniobacter sp.]
MFYVFAIVGLVLLVRGMAPRIAAWKRSTPAERSFAIRFTAFTWLFGFLCLLAFLFLPNKGRVLMAVPVFLVASSLVKWWKTGRARLRSEARMDEGFARAKRVN